MDFVTCTEIVTQSICNLKYNHSLQFSIINQRWELTILHFQENGSTYETVVLVWVLLSLVFIWFLYFLRKKTVIVAGCSLHLEGLKYVHFCLWWFWSASHDNSSRCHPQLSHFFRSLPHFLKLPWFFFFFSPFWFFMLSERFREKGEL